jgi:hypothetical protein
MPAGWRAWITSWRLKQFPAGPSPWNSYEQPSQSIRIHGENTLVITQNLPAQC